MAWMRHSIYTEVSMWRREVEGVIIVVVLVIVVEVLGGWGCAHFQHFAK
jgi:hypothetical protein